MACCGTMRSALHHDCPDHPDPWDCPDTILAQFEESGIIGIPVRDGGHSLVILDHCPWCTASLNGPVTDG